MKKNLRKDYSLTSRFNPNGDRVFSNMQVILSCQRCITRNCDTCPASARAQEIPTLKEEIILMEINK
jgi:hypothetical protein